MFLLSLSQAPRFADSVLWLKMCHCFRNELLECFALLLLLRLAKVSAPPVVGDVKWLSVESLDNLHEVFSGCGCDDNGLRLVQDILFQTHRLDQALLGLPSLRDSWARIVRSQRTQAMLWKDMTKLLTLRAGRLGSYADRHAGSLVSFHRSCLQDVWSSMISSFNCLQEKHMMCQEDFDVAADTPTSGTLMCSPQAALARRWRASALHPQGGVEVEMDLPGVSQGEWDLLITYWNFFVIVTCLLNTVYIHENKCFLRKTMLVLLFFCCFLKM